MPRLTDKYHLGVPTDHFREAHRFRDPAIARMASVAAVLGATMVGTYTVTTACSWTGMYNGAEVTVAFSTGALTPTTEQQYILDNFVVPQGYATNPAGQTGAGAGTPTPPPPLPAGDVLETDGTGRTQWQVPGAWVQLVGGSVVEPIQDMGGQVFNALAYGVKADGSTDDTAAWNALFVTVATAGGGAIYLPGGRHSVCLGALTPMPYGTSCPYTRIFGAGSYADGSGAGLSKGASILDLRYSGSGNPAKIDCRGLGLLEIDHLSIVSGGSDNWPIFQTTNTTVHAHHNKIVGNVANSGTSCVQDGFVLGSTTTNYDGSSTAGFRGYGTIIEKNAFSHIRQGILCQTYCNGTILGPNAWDGTCGGDATHGAITLDATHGEASGNVLLGNLVECIGYVYGVIFRSATNNYGFGNQFWDPGAGYISDFLDGGLSGNQMFGTYGGGGSGGVGPTPRSGSGYGFGGQVVFGGSKGGVNAIPLMVMPDSPPSVYEWMFTVNRSLGESLNPGQQVFGIYYDGSVTALAGFTLGGWLSFSPGGSITSAGGQLQLYAGTANEQIKAASGLYADNAFTTAGRPSASTLDNGGPGGCCYYDTTLHKPAWSDGAGHWRDAMGNIV
jgi:hypothetical protein